MAVVAVVLLVQGANRPADPELSPAGTSSPSAPSTSRQPLDGFEEIAFAIAAGDEAAAATSRCALLADESASRQQGLTGQEDLRGYDAMVFRFPEPTEVGFTMRGTPQDLTVAFFDEEGAFVGSLDMAPCPEDAEGCPSYPPPEEYLHALEVAPGDLTRLGIQADARLAFPEGGCPG